MGYGTNSELVRASVKAAGKTIANATTIIGGVLLIVGDIAIGGIGFDVAFEQADGVIFGIAASTLLGFGFSAVTTAIQIAIWNFIKAVRRDMKFKVAHIATIAFAVIVAILDTMGDLGGLTSLTTGYDGHILPGSDALPMVWVIIILGGLVCLCGEALLDFFFDFDSPIASGLSRGRRLRSVSEPVEEAS